MDHSHKAPEPSRRGGIDWKRPQSDWEVPLRIPITKGDRTGPSVRTTCMIMSAITERSLKENRFVAGYHAGDDDRIEWCESTQPLLCEIESDRKTLFALDVADEATMRRLGVPSFNQDPEWPMCCGRSMHFVGQIDDESICEDPPPGAKLWWHDAASFYVFTCAICLECKAIGQQY